MNAGQWDCRFRISSAHYQRNRQFLKAEEFQRNSVILTGKYNKGYRLHVARQFCMLWKTRGHENWQHSVPTWCFLWRLLRCVWLEAALLDRSVCVSSKYCESYKRADVSLCFISPYFDVIRSIFKSNTPIYSYSRVSRDSVIAASAVEKIAFCHIAILLQMQLIVQP